MRPQAVPDPDADLERAISDELTACEQARSDGRRDEMRQHWERFVSLIAKRSPKQVSRMEKARGLR